MQGGTSCEEEDGAPRRREQEQILFDAVLRIAGREGLEDTSVQLVVGDAKTSRDACFQNFGGIEECFRLAYAHKAHELCEKILTSGRRGTSWVEGLRLALRVLLEFVAEQPHTAKALIIEGGRTSGPSNETRDLVLKRLARALDSARRQSGSRHSAPPLTGDLMVGAITNTLHALLVKGESARAPTLLGDYTYLVVLAYFGEETAYRAMESVDREA
jgi:AcrR family transcriptional regulator